MAGSKVTVGNIEIVSLLDTPMDFDWKGFFPNNDPIDFEPYRQSHPGAYAGEQFRTYSHAYAIRSQGRTLLCDAGVGPGPHSFLGGRQGRLLQDMREKGVDRDEVETVVFTHLHFDHTGWSLAADGSPTFPRARYFVPQADWDFFNSQEKKPPNIPVIAKLQELGVVELFSGERALTPEVTTYPTPGHTPGHTSLLLASGGERAILTGDLAHHPAQVEHPDWRAGADTDPDQAEGFRRRVLDQLEAEGLLAAICHFPDPGFGKVVRLQGRRVWQAL